MDNVTFTYLKDLGKRLEPKMIEELLTQHLVGDPDWLADIISELDYIKPNNPNFIKGFHDALIGFKAKDFDFQTLYADIQMNLDNRPILRKRLALAYIEKFPEYKEHFTQDYQLDFKEPKQ